MSLLDVGDGHRIHFEVHGAPDGVPAVVLHGGPGSGCGPWWLGHFDLGAHRVVMFDQRGCGRSRPVGEVRANTTQHLVADIERLREHAGAERWLVLGGSWGSTLALAYGQAHPERVRAMVLFSVVTTTAREVAWITEDMGRLAPAAWDRFRALVPAGERAVDAYHRQLMDPDPEVHGRAARAWCEWEATHVGGGEDARYRDPAFRLTFARLVTHYWRHAAFLPDGALARGVPGVPAVLIHGRLDLSSPLDVPYRLAAAWPEAELVVVEHEDHRGGAAMDAAIRAALAAFAAR